jgi:alpha-N-acetylglucosamine transferase
LLGHKQEAHLLLEAGADKEAQSNEGGRPQHYAADQGERWGHMATKLRLWELTQYKRVLYLDADTVLTGPVTSTFESITTFGAEAPKYHSHFNAGVLLLTPSKVVFDELLVSGKEQAFRVRPRLFDSHAKRKSTMQQTDEASRTWYRCCSPVSC